MGARLASCATAVLIMVAASAGSAVGQTEPDPVTTPDAQLTQLVGVSLAAADLSPSFAIQPYGGGTEVKGRVSLDLCGGGKYASELLRTGRYQVAVVPATEPDPSMELASTEAISYSDEAAARQAMTELATAARTCPRSTFVPSGVVNSPATSWQFNRAPDTSWKNVAGVQRLAFDVTLDDAEGNTGREHLIYLRHGPVIVGIYGQARFLNLVAAPQLKGERGLVKRDCTPSHGTTPTDH